MFDHLQEPPELMDADESLLRATLDIEEHRLRQIGVRYTKARNDLRDYLNHKENRT